MDEITKNTNNSEEGGDDEIALPPLSSTSSEKKEASLSATKKPDEKKEEGVGTEKPAVSSLLPKQAPTSEPKETENPTLVKPDTPVPSVSTKPLVPKEPVLEETAKTVEPINKQNTATTQPEVKPTATPLQNEVNNITPELNPTKKNESPITSTTTIPEQTATVVATQPSPKPDTTIPTTAKTTPTIVIPSQTTHVDNTTAKTQSDVPSAPTTQTPIAPMSPANLIKDAKERLAHEAVTQPIQQNVTPPTSTATAPSTTAQAPIQQATVPQVNAGASVPTATTQTVASPPLHPPTSQKPSIPTATSTPSTKKPPEIGTSATPDTKASFLPNLRTFKGDISNAMKAKKTSLISMAAAQQDKIVATPKKTEKEAGGGNIKKMLIALVGGLLILSGISFAAFTFISQTPPDNVLIERNIPSLIFVDNTQALDISGKSRREVMNGLTFLKDGVGIQLGLLEQIVPVFRDNFDTVEVTNSRAFLSAIDARVPDSFVRSLDPEFTLGVHSFDGNQPFLIFKVKNFRTAFADILSWEDNMSDDLSPLFGLPLPTFIVKEIPVVAEGTASTTPEDSTSETTIDIPQKRVFTDVVIKNQDVRVLKDDDGKIALLYTFPNEETVVITTNENTLSEILTRLGSTRVF